jgi:PAS domain S-box-containing protein
VERDPPPSGEQELRAAELAAALRETAYRYRDLFERNLAGVYRTTARGRILEVNPAFARTFGYDSPDEMRAVPAQSLFFDPADREAILSRLRAHGEVRWGELRMRRRDGGTVWVLFSEQLRSSDDDEEVIEGTLIDITSRKETEAGIVQAGRLAAVGTLAAGVVHEVNNPLSGILANLGYSLETIPAIAAALPEGTPAHEAARELTSALQDARAAGERVRDIIRHLRLFARAEDEDRAPLEVARVLDAAVALLANQIRHRARLERVTGDAPEVIGNESRLGKAFLNLLLNAVQALPDGFAASHLIRVSLGRSPVGEAVVEITDDGEGMAPDVLARAFDPFFSTRGRTGAGLGLPTARAIVASMGGTLSLESAPGRGTSVRVVLPAASPGPRARIGTPSAAPPSATPSTTRCWRSPSRWRSSAPSSRPGGPPPCSQVGDSERSGGK